MTRPCHQCNQTFEITDDDLAFYEKVSPRFPVGTQNLASLQIPPPTLCPGCRRRRRLVWRNEHTLYNDACDKCGKEMISVYSPDKPFTVYCSSCWWDDANDPLSHGRPYDFSKSFTEQFRELLQHVPRINLSNSNNENCEYVNYTNYSKNCYLIFGNHQSEKCAYCWRVHGCVGCFDCTQLNDCQYCYSCTDCDACYEIAFARNCQNCSTSRYLYNCRGLSNCFLCCNLFNKEYCIMNEQYSKEEYERKMKELPTDPNALTRLFNDFILTLPRKAVNNISCENCRGDYLTNCKSCSYVFSAKACQDCAHVSFAEKAVDCRDCDIVGWPAELCYEGISTCVNAVRNIFCSLCWTCSDITYCDSCFNSQNLFGCTGMKKQQYCILNKQYSKEEYNTLVPKIIEHMKTTGEWGEFFSPSLSLWGYNETAAQDHLPLSHEEALQREFTWSGYIPPPPKVDRIIPAEKLPASIGNVPDKILNWAIECEMTKRPFRIIKQELKFLRERNLPLPRRHPDQRNLDRLQTRNPNTLFERTCMNCSKPIQTTYAPDRPEKVFCEECYLREVY